MTNEPEVKLPDLPLKKLQFLIREYQSGKLSNYKIGAEIKRSEKFVRIWAARMGLKKNLAQEVRQRTMEKLLGIQNAEQERSKCGTGRDIAANIKENAVESAANTNVAVIRSHQGITGKLKVLSDQLVTELEIISKYPEQMDRVAEIIAAADFPDEDDEKHVKKQLAMFRKALTLGSRVSDLTNLANAISKILDAERKAFNLDADPNEKGGGSGELGVELEVLLAALKEEETVEVIEHE
jgi:hypothetical protein